MATTAADAEFMGAALALAARTLGDTWPNPAVGCVIVKNGIVVGRGWTHSGGRPHAETEALKRAGTAAKGAVAYVTLEPCSHHGQTPPCSDALIAAGVARVVVATADPNPKVNGQGIAALKAAGIAVDQGVCEAEAKRQNAGFFLTVTQNRPLFALKTATTLDGKIALGNGQSQWITGPRARQAGHALRARFDAILVGSGTALADDPLLTCRLEGYAGRPKVRIVLDRRGRLPATAKVLTTKDAPTWALKTENAEAVAAELAGRGLTRVLIEGGGAVAAAFLKAGLVDEIAWFRAPTVAGGDGIGAIGAFSMVNLTDLPAFKRRETLVFEADTLDILDRHGA
jgi:diaminohydroxyphosphoribosylaminopyrimidine deaminase/5-amino-6-(5-phosphoribosylamino)uracil reductase